MYQKCFAYQTAALLTVVLVSGLLQEEPFRINQDDFTTVIGKLFFMIAGFFMIIPVITHFFSMWWSSLRNTKVIWFLLMMLLGPFASVPYYFIVYREFVPATKQ